jgi:hypothetical protein
MGLILCFFIAPSPRLDRVDRLTAWSGSRDGFAVDCALQRRVAANLTIALSASVLEALLAHVLEGVREPVADMVADGARDADAARRRQSLQPRCDVDAVAVNVVAVGEITSPRLTPMRNRRRRSSARSRSRSAIACCTATAQRTASTTLPNSTSKP